MQSIILDITKNLLHLVYMKKFLLVVTLFLVSFAYSQVVIVNNTNLNGFTLIGAAFETKFPDRIELSSGCPFVCTDFLDTLLNLAGYDSLKIIFTSWTSGSFSSFAKINNISINVITPATYTITSTNTLSLSLVITLFAGGGGGGQVNLRIKDLKIIGYPSIPTAINENKNLSNNEFVYINNKFIFSGNIKSQKLIVYDVLGNIVMNKNLEETNPIDLSTGVYLVRIIDNGNVVYNKKFVFGK